MKKTMNYKKRRELFEALAGVAMAWIFFAMLYITLCIFA